MAKFTRQCELQADVMATGIVARAGYDPEAVVRYLERLPVVVAWPTRPTVSERVEAIRAEMEKLGARVSAGGRPAGSGEFNEVRVLADHLSGPTAPHPFN